jgi:hypothetical protein
LRLDEQAARTKAEKPLVCGQKRARETERKSSDDAGRIANAKAVMRVVPCERISKEQPPETSFDAHTIFTTGILTVGSVAELPVEEACHIGQCRT